MMENNLSAGKRIADTKISQQQKETVVIKHSDTHNVFAEESKPSLTSMYTMSNGSPLKDKDSIYYNFSEYYGRHLEKLSAQINLITTPDQQP